MRVLEPVVTYAGMIEALRTGAQLSVVCRKSVTREGGGHNFRGEWLFYVKFPDEPAQVYVVNQKITPRVVKTLNGVIALLCDLGFKVASVPLLAGESVVQSNGSAEVRKES
jgi:hypothetical protein